MRVLGAILVAFALIAGLATIGTGPAFAGGLPPGGTFVDDDLNPHEGFIEAIAAIGVTQGCDAAAMLYCPNGNVTRAQMASFIARALGLPASSTDFFSDDNTSTHEANINAIAQAGITLGFPDGTFQPDGFVSRAQMASFLARGLELPEASDDFFSDDDGNTHEDNINKMAANGITLGCDSSGTIYCPADDVRRDQMASFLGRALDLTEIVPPPPTSTTSTTDGSTSTTDDVTTTTDEATTTTTEPTTTTTDAPETEFVTVGDNFFSDTSISISVGDSVQFSKGVTANAHNVNFASASIPDSGIPTTAAFTHTVTFSSAGSFSFVCDVHAFMSGTVTVDG
jgi:plastocyanin